MRKCPWCGRENLNVYAYCQSCGRGFDEPDPAGTAAKRGQLFLRTSLAISAGLAVVAVASAAMLLLNQEDSEPAAAESGPQPTAVPAPFEGVIVEKGSLFLTTEFSLPPETEVTLVEDNQDPQIPHNIRFFAAAETGGDTLGGCIEGCDGDDLVTPIRMGVTRNPFTFTTPVNGRYAFHCDVHPTTMKGTLIVEDGAPIPGAGD